MTVLGHWTKHKYSRTYRAIHHWLERNYGKANKCESQKCKGTSSRYDWALVKGRKYLHKRENFIMLCRSCHIKYDWKRSRLKKILRYKKVVQLTVKQELVRIWDSIIDASRSLRIDSSSISSVCLDKRKTAGGYKWKHLS